MNEKNVRSGSIEDEFANVIFVGEINFEKKRYKEAIKCYQKSLKILQMNCDHFEENDKSSKFMNIYWKMSVTYEALAKQTNSLVKEFFFLLFKI